MAMYREHFGLQGKPFSIAPDPRFLFMSQRHREALAHLLYGIGEGGGFVQLTGEVGTGKTTVCRCLLEQLPDNVDVALILNPKLTAIELVASVCDELHIQYPSDAGSLKPLIDVLNQHLLATHSGGRRTVLIIDEAQNLSTEVLEQIRLLTNLETSTDKLLQIILIGQPELGDLLGLYEMRQLAQRITARYHLGALTRQETIDYIHHRLRICGGSGRLFESRATNEIYRFSTGIPRLINILCDRALLGAYTENKPRVDIKTVRRAASEIKTTATRSHNASPSTVKSGAWRWAWVAIAAFAIGLVWLSRSDVVDKWTAPVLQAATDDVPDVVVEKEVPNPAVDIKNKEAPKQPLAKKIDTDNPVSSTAAATTELGAFLLSLPSEARQQAGQALLVRWGIGKEQLGNGGVCSEAERHGLRCMKGKGSWSGLRNIDRPVLLELVTASNQRVPVVLQVLDDVTAGIESGGMMRKIPIGILDQYWQGQYTILWRPPIPSSSLRLGDSGDDVLWLRTRMQDILDTEEITANPAQFDEGLKGQVIRFQGIRGLEKDGIAGKRTLIHINTLTQGAQVPRLFGPGA